MITSPDGRVGGPGRSEDGEGAPTGDTVRVRDHARPCEHGRLWPHWITTKNAKWWQEPECLGGMEMILRRRPEGLWEEIPAEGTEQG